MPFQEGNRPGPAAAKNYGHVGRRVVSAPDVCKAGRRGTGAEWGERAGRGAGWTIHVAVVEVLTGPVRASARVDAPWRLRRFAIRYVPAPANSVSRHSIAGASGGQGARRPATACRAERVGSSRGARRRWRWGIGRGTIRWQPLSCLIRCGEYETI